MPDQPDKCGGPDRDAELRAMLNEIVDPCSVAAGTAIGLTDMGVVQDVVVAGDAVHVTILPTFPACRFVPIFEDAIIDRLAAAGLKARVSVLPPTSLWDEGLMASAARDRLRATRGSRHRPIARASEGQA